MATQIAEPTPTEAGRAQDVLEATNLTRVYGDLLAVDSVSFGVRAGEVVGLLGPNGAGKTTIMRILTTMLAPSAGEFSVLGHGADQAGVIRRVIGVFPENSAAPGSQTGREELRYHARLHGYPKPDADQLAASLLAEVDLEAAADRRAGGYSRGMRQRLGIARALIGDPAVILLDEPTLGLDPAGRRQVLDIILHAAADRGSAVIVSTHLLDEVERVCDRVLIMDRGQLVAQGTVDELRARSGLPSRAHLHIDGDLDVAIALMEGVPAVGDIDRGPPGSGELQMELNDVSGDAVPALVGTLIGSPTVRLRSFTFEPAGLEEVFLALTGGVR